MLPRTSVGGALRLAVALLVVGSLVAGTVGSAAALGADAPSAASGSTGIGGTAAATTDSHCSFPVTRTDVTGTEVTIDAEPSAVVTLAPSAAQTVWEIGEEGRVVGVSQYAAYLDNASAKANVSGAGQTTVNVERVIELQPDLVLAPNVIRNDSVRSLRDAGLTVYKFDTATSIPFVVEKTRLTGRLLGACDAADSRADRLEEDVATVERAVEGEDRPRVLYYFFGFTAGEGTFVHELITLAGGENVAAQAGIDGYREISPETVVERDPEWLVLNSDSPQTPRSEAFNETTAVREDNVVVLDANYISQPAPRLVQSLTKLAEAVHPEAYAEANATPTPTQTPPPTTGPTVVSTTASSAEPTDTDTGISAPGFGLLAAAIAVLAAGLLARRD